MSSGMATYEVWPRCPETRTDQRIYDRPVSWVWSLVPAVPMGRDRHLLACHQSPPTPPDALRQVDALRPARRSDRGRGGDVAGRPGPGLILAGLRHAEVSDDQAFDIGSIGRRVDDQVGGRFLPGPERPVYLFPGEFVPARDAPFAPLDPRAVDIPVGAFGSDDEQSDIEFVGQGSALLYLRLTGHPVEHDRTTGDELRPCEGSQDRPADAPVAEVRPVEDILDLGVRTKPAHGPVVRQNG
jgi:hypothetical protein